MATGGTASGGQGESGGAAATGGSGASGGTAATGGFAATGGTSATGGVPASGGSATAGTGGDTGGSGGTGGAGSGGSSGTGGSSGGGASGTAGAGGSAGSHDPAIDGFVHPGILVSQASLDFVRDKVDANEQPWRDALGAASSSRYGSLSYTSNARETVECGSYSNPDVGCSDEKNDVQAAYTHALLFCFTGNEAHADKAIEIMNDWSYTIRNHTNSNAPLQSAWVMETFPRAAEIIRYTYDGWSAADIAQFETMLDEVYLPLIVDGSSSNGNWELSMIEGVINIGVFNDDVATFEKGVSMWRERVPAYVYLESDGPLPVSPPRGGQTGDALINFWYGQTTFVDGVCQETCRDMGHTQYGLAALINAAETAQIQGVDLYGEEEARILATIEFHAQYINGAPVPDWLCGGSIDNVYAAPMWEIVYNHYVARLGRSAPETQQLVLGHRPTGTDHHMAWETLTHGGTGTAGL